MSADTIPPFDPIHQLLGPHIALKVAHNCQERRECQEGSRDEVIDLIMDWATKEDAPSILWLHGPAGSGKSTIALTVCSKFAIKDESRDTPSPRQQLAASWFFSRDANRTTTRGFFTTIAYHLALSQEFLRGDMEKTLKNNPSIVQQNPKGQLKKLILDQIRPFAGSLHRPIIIVVDALDECTEGDVQNLVEALVDAFQDDGLLPIRFILTSRNDYAPMEGHYQLNSEMIRRVDLWEYDAHASIRRFFEVELEKVERRRSRLIGAVRPWPSQSQLETLTKKAGGLFIYASTLVAFVGDNQGRPDQKLAEAMKPQYSGLDALYRQVLDSAPQSRTTRFRNIIGIILYPYYPRFTIVDLAHLMGAEAVDIRADLEGCGSIFMVPEDDHGVIKILHASLAEFLKTEERSKSYFIGYPEYRLLLLDDCIQLLLREYSSLPNGPPFMPRYLATCSAVVSYAYNSWLRNLSYMLNFRGSSLVMDSALVAHLIDLLSNIKSKGSVEMWMFMAPREGFTGIMSMLSFLQKDWDPSSQPNVMLSSLLRSFEAAISRHMWLLDCPSVKKFNIQQYKDISAADLTKWARSKEATSDGIPHITVCSIAWGAFNNIIIIIGLPCAAFVIYGCPRSGSTPRIETFTVFVNRTVDFKQLAVLTITDQQLYLIDILRLLQIFEFAELSEVDCSLGQDVGRMWFVGCFWRNLIQHLPQHGSKFETMPAWEEDDRFEAPGASDGELQKALRFADIQQTTLLAKLKDFSVAEGLDEVECLHRMNNAATRIEEEFSKQMACLRASRAAAPSPSSSLEPSPPATTPPTPTLLSDTLSAIESTTVFTSKSPLETSPADITQHAPPLIPEAPSTINLEPSTPSTPESPPPSTLPPSSITHISTSEPTTPSMSEPSVTPEPPSILEPPPTPTLPPSSIVSISTEPLTDQTAQQSSVSSEIRLFQPFNVLLVVAFFLPLLLLALRAIYGG
ncbi:hypothetical protein JAAARDRAFT_205640 [Jaapia argillacea MUCL 33604]|uniref:NACHT domain-containing protein n=1 Tax=Jaapia argillacea MUCL 33604 TaxID=933084 RepID=A0A067Q7Z7_9AGAM|nr:hypothetical protein JAAARDRAFT_205640 [Jaapia argillacea MUCL 33604]